DNTLPFNLDNGKKVLLLSNQQDRLNLMELEMNNIIEKLGVTNVTIDKSLYSNGSLTDKIKNQIDSADYIIMETYNLNSNSVFPIEASQYANEKNKKLATMSSRNPYDIAYLPDVKANIAIYGSSGYDQTQQGEAALPINIPVGLDTIFGLVNPTGKLPVSIPKVNDLGNLYEIGYGLTYQPKVDKDELEKIITEAESLNKEEYTKESWNALEKALNIAKDIYNKDNVNQDEIDETKLNLEKAINALIKKTDQNEANKVIDQINKLPALDKLTLKDKKKVQSARAAYDKLTEAQSA